MFNRRFHEVKPGLRVFGRCLSFADSFVNHRGDREMTVALRNDSDITVTGDVNARYAYLKQRGMFELYDGFLVNIDNIASMELGNTEIVLNFSGKEGKKVLQKKKVPSPKRMKEHLAQIPHNQFDQIRNDLHQIEGEVLQNIDNMQETLEGLILQVINLEAGIVNLNAALASNSLQADSIQVG